MRLVSRYIITLTVGYGGNCSPLVVGVTGDKCACAVGDAYNVVLRVADIVVLLVIVAERIDVSVCIGVEAELCSVASAAENENASVVIVELGSNSIYGLGDSLSRRIVARGNAPSNTPFDNQTEGIPPFGSCKG